VFARWAFPEADGHGLSILMGLGVAAQAVSGAWLLRRYGGFSGALAGARDVTRFLLFAGPLGCLVSATWATGCLFSAGAIHAADVPGAWSTWWIGDSIGALVVAPLVRAASGSSWISKRRLVLLVLPSVACMGVTLLAFLGVAAVDKQRMQGTFDRQAGLA
jgi:integral membrane sensor domain MASE1